MRSLSVLILLLAVCFVSGQKADAYLISYIDSSSGQELIGYKSPSRRVIIPAKYTNAYPDTFNKMAFVLKEGEWMGINTRDSVILTPFIFDNGPDYLVEGLFRFVENKKMGFANLNGDKIIPALFDFVRPFENGLAEYTLGGERMYVSGGEHWIWAGGYESGYVNRREQLFKEVSKLQNGRREAWTKEGKHVQLNKKGEIIKTYHP